MTSDQVASKPQLLLPEQQQQLQTTETDSSALNNHIQQPNDTCPSEDSAHDCLPVSSAVVIVVDDPPPVETIQPKEEVLLYIFLKNIFLGDSGELFSPEKGKKQFFGTEILVRRWWLRRRRWRISCI